MEPVRIKTRKTPEIDPAEASYPCPNCDEDSPSIRYLTVPFVLFFLTFAQTRQSRMVGCTRCRTTAILRHMLANIVTANIIWPFTVLPWSIRELLRVRAIGHSPEYLRSIGVRVPKHLREKSAWEESQESSPVAFGLLGGLQIVASLLFFLVNFAIFCGTWYSATPGQDEGSKSGLMWFDFLLFCLPGGYLLYSGSNKFLRRTPALLERLGGGIAIALVVLAISPAVAKRSWRSTETGLYIAAMGDTPGGAARYFNEIPPPLWRPAPIERYVDEILEKGKKMTPVWTRTQLQGPQRLLQRYHPNALAFDEVNAKVEQAMKTK